MFLFGGNISFFVTINRAKYQKNTCKLAFSLGLR